MQRADAAVLSRATRRFKTKVRRPLPSTSFHAERSHSGLVHRSRKPEWVYAHRGFESHPLRSFLITYGRKLTQLSPLIFARWRSQPARQAYPTAQFMKSDNSDYGLFDTLFTESDYGNYVPTVVFKVSRTLRARALGVNGFSMNAVPSSNTP